MESVSSLRKNPYPQCVILLGPNDQTLVFAKSEDWVESDADPYFVARDGTWVDVDEMR